jgi:hypothetical protein
VGAGVRWRRLKIAHLNLENYFIRNHRQNRPPNFVKKVCGGVKKVNSIRSSVAEQVAFQQQPFRRIITKDRCR